MLKWKTLAKEKDKYEGLNVAKAEGKEGGVYCITLSKPGKVPVILPDWLYSLFHYKDGPKFLGSYSNLKSAKIAAEANEEDRDEEEAEQLFTIGAERIYEVMARTAKEAIVKYKTGQVDWNGEETVIHVLDADGNNHTKVVD